MLAHKLTVRAAINGWSGFGQLACEIIAGLSHRGWDVEVQPLRLDENCHGRPCPIPLEIKEKITDKPTSDTELLVTALDRPNLPTPGKRTVVFSMWESTRLSARQTAVINRADNVVVPGRWMREVFLESGVTKPVHIVPLGVSPEIFTVTPVALTGPCVFGAAGDLTGSGPRKRLDFIMDAFLHAFAGVDDVELHLKTMPMDSFTTKDPRVKVRAELLSWDALNRWFGGLTAFVNVGVEGWGLLAHQAMACGRPVLSIDFGGVTEFFNRDVGYPVRHWMHWNQIGNRELGAFARADFSSLSEQMRRVYFDRQEAAETGNFAGQVARLFTWGNTVDKLEEILLEALSQHKKVS